MSNQNLAQVETERLWTDEEYLAFERASDEKHELINGRLLLKYGDYEVEAMAGASRRHNLITGNTFGELRQQLKGRNCEIYASDMRVRMRNRLYGYPDVVIVCGEPQFADGEFDTLLNPIAVVEVLSKSTKFRDRNEKLETYREMESVREYLLIEQDRMFAQLYRKQSPTQWLLNIAESADAVLTLESINCRIALSDVYAQVKFETSAAED